MLTCSQGAETLLKAGADPRARTLNHRGKAGTQEEGETAWDIARHAGAVDVLNVLVKYLQHAK